MEVSGQHHASVALHQGEDRNILELRLGGTGPWWWGGGCILDVVKKGIPATATTIGQSAAHPFVIGNRNNGFKKLKEVLLRLPP